MTPSAFAPASSVNSGDAAVVRRYGWFMPILRIWLRISALSRASPQWMMASSFDGLDALELQTEVVAADLVGHLDERSDPAGGAALSLISRTPKRP